MKTISFMKFLFKLIIYKIKYGKRLKIGKKNHFNGDFNCSVFGNASISIGRNNSSRGYMMIRAFSNGQLLIGNSCFFNSNFSITCCKKVHIGDNCIFGNNVVIVDHNHDFRSDDFKNSFISSDVEIGDNCWIGANVVILKGSKIGSGCIIGAGTILRGVIPDNSIVYNNNQLIIKNKE